MKAMNQVSEKAMGGLITTTLSLVVVMLGYYASITL